MNMAKKWILATVLAGSVAGGADGAPGGGATFRIKLPLSGSNAP